VRNTILQLELELAGLKTVALGPVLCAHCMRQVCEKSNDDGREKIPQQQCRGGACRVAKPETVRRQAKLGAFWSCYTLGLAHQPVGESPTEAKGGSIRLTRCVLRLKGLAMWLLLRFRTWASPRGSQQTDSTQLQKDMQSVNHADPLVKKLVIQRNKASY
jgi:hypothetical protein